MGKHWSDETAMVEAIAHNLFEALPLLPKRLVRVDSITREYGMPFSHIQILSMLSERDMTIGEISSYLGIAKPNITPLLDHLNHAGLVERCRDANDRRIVNVHLLPTGQEMAGRIQQSIAGQVAQWPENLSHSDVKRLNNALALLIDMGRRLAEEDQKR